MTENNMRNAFVHSGFACDIDDDLCTLLSDRDMLIGSEAFHEPWEINYPLELLLTGRRETGFGWINEYEVEALGD
jgi:hypothetical protein